MYKTLMGVTISGNTDDGHPRMWLNIGEKFEKLRMSLEIPWCKKVSPGFSIHFGDKGSETPVDIWLSFYWLAFFWSINFPGLGAFCAKIGRGHKRNISLRFFGGQMWWELWHDDDGGYDRHHQDKCDSWRHPKVWPWSRGRKKHRGWMCLREGNIDLNPLDALWGSRYYHREILEEKYLPVYIDEFEGDAYSVRFRFERTFRYRDHGPKWARGRTDEGYDIDWWHTPGIPTQNHDWKGDNTLGSGFSGIETVDDWETVAAAKLVEWVKKERVSRGYRPRPAEEERSLSE